MKKTYKILIASIISFFIITLFCTNVFAYNITYNSWRYDVNNDGKQDLLFRRYSLSTSEELKKYHKETKSGELKGYYYNYDNTNYVSKWVYVEEEGIHKPSETEFSTVGYTIHKEPLNKYVPSDANNAFGSFGLTGGTSNLLDNIKSIEKGYKTKLNQVSLREGINTNGMKKVEYFGVKSALKEVDFGTQLNMSTITPKDKMVYRYAIVYLEGVGNVYIEDRVIYNEDVNNFIDKMGTFDLEEDTPTREWYISDIVVSKSKNDVGGYEVAKNMKDFLNQYKKYGYTVVDGTSNFYPNETFGVDSDSDPKGINSILNVFDNIISLPKTSTKNVYVRHINLGNTQKLSTSAVYNYYKGERFSDSILNEQRTLTTIDPNKIVQALKDNNGNYKTNMGGMNPINLGSYIVDEAYENVIDVYSGVQKSALNLADMGCIGYNISYGTSFESATKNIHEKIEYGIYTPGSVVKLDGSDKNSDTEYIVIDFYYTEQPEEVIVNHLYVDEDNKIMPLTTERVVISDKDYAYTGAYYDKQVPLVMEEHNSVSQNTSLILYTQAKYYRTKGQSLLVKTANSVINNPLVECVGYATYDNEVSNESLEGQMITPQTSWDYNVSNMKGVKVSSNVKQINFYYYKQDKVEAHTPEKQISLNYEMEIYCKQGENCEDKCYNGKCENIDTFPSGMDVNIGLTDLKQAMVAAMTVEKINPAENVRDFELKLSYSFGDEVITTNIDSIKYSFGYYRISKLAFDVLNTATLYDASNKWENTTGTRIFEWKNRNQYTDKKDLAVNPYVQVRIKGSNYINNTNKEIQNWKNYVKINVKDDKGNNASGVETLSLKGTYLSADDLKKVDANGDNKLIGLMGCFFEDCDLSDELKPYCDIHYQRDIVDKLYNELEEIKNGSAYASYTSGEHERLKGLVSEAEANKKAAENAYKAALEAEKEAKELYEKEKATLDEIRNTYKSASETIDNAGASYPTQSDEDSLKIEEETKETRLGEIKQEITELEADNVEQDRLIATYETNISTYNKDISNIAACTDSSSKCKWGDIGTEYKDLEYLNEALEEMNGYTTEDWGNYANTVKINYIYNTNNYGTPDILKPLLTELNNLNKTLVQQPNLYNLKDTLTAKQNDYNTAKNNYDNNNCEDILSNEQLTSYQKQDCKNYEAAMNDAASAKETAETEYINAMNTVPTNIKETIGIAIEKQEEVIAKLKEHKTEKYTGLREAEEAKKTDAKDKIDANNDLITAKTTEKTQIENALNVINAKLKYIEFLGKELAQFIEVASALADYETKQADVVLRWSAHALATSAYETAKGNLELFEIVYNRKLEAIASKQEEYDKALEYFNYMKEYFDDYLEKYDAFVALKNAINDGNTTKVIELLGLEANITAYNMYVDMQFDEKGQFYALTNNGQQIATLGYKSLSDVMVNAPELKVGKPVFGAAAYTGIGATKDAIAEATINKDILNGVRTIAAEVQYRTQVLIGGAISPRTIEDNVYYSDYISDKNTDAKKNVGDAVFKIDYEGIVKSTTKQVNIYTPISVSAELTSDGVIDQRDTEPAESAQTIQLSTPFTIKLSNSLNKGDDKAYYEIEDTSRFCKGYYIKFDYDIHQVKINGKTYNNGKRIKAGTWIGLIENTANSTIEAMVYSEVKDATVNIADEERSSYVVRAVAYNSTYNMREEMLKYTIEDLLKVSNPLKQTVENICAKPSYIAERKYNVVVLNRVYDFRITDIKDLSWKNVFRKPVNNTVNAHTGVTYYTGINKWQVNNYNNNVFVRRTVSEVGNAPVRILPLGPYKNTDLTYVKAPKLGYTFSYDLKVTGAYYGNDGKALDDKKVVINTKFYYISDDGKTFLQEGKNGIYLFYKNSDGQYIRIGADGGNYNLSFVPNDGYRLLSTTELITLSKNKESLGDLRNITLKSNMATVSPMYNTDISANNGLVITYYGEYKLPNSTIAVKVDSNGNYDINKPLKNGYIGVVFDIKAYVAENTALSYSRDTKGNNTSQWDYEGFLGLTKTGENANVTMKLEGGIWTLTEEQYDAVKGTVILYDVDERAANDYE